MNLTQAMKAIDLENQKKDKIQNLEIIFLELSVKRSGHEAAIKIHEQEIKRLDNDIKIINSELIAILKEMING